MRRSAGLPAIIAGVIAATAAVVGLATHTQSGAAAGPCAPAGALMATTAHDTMGLVVGPAETMYTQAQANAQHPTSGEIMLGGAGMPGAGGTSPGAAPSASKDMRHLEVHICASDTGQVVQNASPTITVADQSSGGTAQSIPVAVMEGVGEGVSDLHYGNNLTMPSGDTFLVTVTLGADRAAYTLTMGPEGMVWGEPTQAAGAAAPAPPPPAAAAPAPPGTGAGTHQAAPPAPPVMPPATGTRAPMPRTGVLTGAAPAVGGALALLGALLGVVVRLRRPQPVTVFRGGSTAVRLGPRR